MGIDSKARSYKNIVTNKICQRFARSYVDKRLNPETPPTKDMMQAHIDNGMSREDLIQQVFISM